eukprot:m.72413 g.72413  ORF g.72413 m.72413 type:complete len:871 (+) comp14259_c0_seq1:160-2772(+)
MLKMVKVGVILWLAAAANALTLKDMPETWSDGISCTLTPSLGCFVDVSGTDRALTHIVIQLTSSMTLEDCMLKCQLANYSYAGATGHTNPSEAACYCDSQINTEAPHAPATDCNVPCPGNTSQNCGGVSRMNVYQGSCSNVPPQPPPSPPLPSGPACSQAAVKDLPFCDPTISIDERVTDLVDRLSIWEAGAQLTARQSPGIPRLGLPPFYWGTNVIHQVRDRASCVKGRCPVTFPDGVAMGSAFNVSLVEGMGKSFGLEMRAFTNLGVFPSDGLTAWGCTINIMRDPRWGRNQETASEDPLWSGLYGKAFAQGMQQGEDPRYMLAVTTLKHFTGYSLEDYMNHTWRRQTFNAIVSEYDLVDTYFPGFEISINEGGARGIMYAVNEINGIPSDANVMLDNKLREWGFDGYRATDGGQIGNIVSGHNYTQDIRQAIAYGMAAESDIDDGSSYQNHLVDAYTNGFVNISMIKRVLFNAFRIRFYLGLFDPTENQPYLKYDETYIGSTTARQLALDGARQCGVLLKNSGVLPFASSDSVAVIGPNANSTKVLIGNYASSGILCPDASHACYNNIAQAITATSSASSYAPGCGIDSSSQSQLNEAVALAKAKDKVVLVLGLDQTLEGEQHDRDTIALPPAQQELFDAIYSVRQDVVVVLVHGGALAISDIKSKAAAILDVHYPGPFGGQATAEMLFGTVNPSGHLPYTVYPISYQNISNFTSMSMTDAPGRTYRYYTGQPLWRFGFGLSYTTFNMSSLTASSSCTSEADTFNVSVKVSNVGDVDGTELVQLYLVPKTLVVQPQHVPMKQLLAFQRVELAAHASESVSLTISCKRAMLASESSGSMARGLLKGDYEIEATGGDDKLSVAVPWSLK